MMNTIQCKRWQMWIIPSVLVTWLSIKSLVDTKFKAEPKRGKEEKSLSLVDCFRSSVYSFLQWVQKRVEMPANNCQKLNVVFSWRTFYLERRALMHTFCERTYTTNDFASCGTGLIAYWLENRFKSLRVVHRLTEDWLCIKRLYF